MQNQFQSLSRRRGSAPVSLPLSKPDDNLPPAGGGLIVTESPSYRRGSVPIEFAHYGRQVAIALPDRPTLKVI